MEAKKFFIGLDVHKATTTYAVRDQLGNIIAEGQTATLYTELRPQLKPYLATAMIGLEASTSYYTLYQHFLQTGYDIKVANTIQLRQLIAKNDRLDARRLAEMLRLGTFPCSYIPDKNIQQLRSLVQTRHALMEERVRCNARIQASLDRSGITMPPYHAFGKHWRDELTRYITSGRTSPEVRFAYDHFLFLETKTQQIEDEMKHFTKQHWNEDYQLLQSITGIGSLLACYIVAHVHPIERFATNRKLRRYAGVIPVTKESGQTTTKGRIPKGSSRKQLRWALVQAANSAAKTDTPLGRYYRKKKRQKKISGIAKIAVASSMIDIIFKVLTTKRPYTSAPSS
jgi:transposase